MNPQITDLTNFFSTIDKLSVGQWALTLCDKRSMLGALSMARLVAISTSLIKPSNPEESIIMQNLTAAISRLAGGFSKYITNVILDAAEDDPDKFPTVHAHSTAVNQITLQSISDVTKDMNKFMMFCILFTSRVMYLVKNEKAIPHEHLLDELKAMWETTGLLEAVQDNGAAADIISANEATEDIVGEFLSPADLKAYFDKLETEGKPEEKKETPPDIMDVFGSAL